MYYYQPIDDETIEEFIGWLTTISRANDGKNEIWMYFERDMNGKGIDRTRVHTGLMRLALQIEPLNIDVYALQAIPPHSRVQTNASLFNNLSWHMKGRPQTF